MELHRSHLQPEYLDPSPLFGTETVTLWYIDTRHPDLVADDNVTARLATATIWSLDEDRTYARLLLRDRYTWREDVISELLQYVATQLHGSDDDVTDTFSTEVFTASPVRSPAGRTVWRRDDHVDASSE